MAKRNNPRQDDLPTLIWLLVDLVAVLFSAFLYPVFGIILGVVAILLVVILILRKLGVEKS